MTGPYVWLVVVAEDGKEQSTIVGAISEGPAIVSYSRPSSTIKELRFQVRSYHWVAFQNISLQPDWKTGVEAGPDRTKLLFQ